MIVCEKHDFSKTQKNQYQIKLYQSISFLMVATEWIRWCQNTFQTSEIVEVDLHGRKLHCKFEGIVIEYWETSLLVAVFGNILVPCLHHNDFFWNSENNFRFGSEPFYSYNSSIETFVGKIVLITSMKHVIKYEQTSKNWAQFEVCWLLWIRCKQ